MPTLLLTSSDFRAGAAKACFACYTCAQLATFKLELLKDTSRDTLLVETMSAHVEQFGACKKVQGQARGRKDTRATSSIGLASSPHLALGSLLFESMSDVTARATDGTAVEPLATIATHGSCLQLLLNGFLQRGGSQN